MLKQQSIVRMVAKSHPPFPNIPPFLHLRYLWADMGVVLGFVLLVPTMAPRKVVQRGRPEPDLLSPTILRSVVGHTVIVIMFQVGFEDTK
jgi:hypothetical protein